MIRYVLPVLLLVALTAVSWRVLGWFGVFVLGAALACAGLGWLAGLAGRVQVHASVLEQRAVERKNRTEEIPFKVAQARHWSRQGLELAREQRHRAES